MSAARGAPAARRRRRTVRNDRGAAFTEYGALILCVAAIAGSVVLVAPSRTADLFSTAVCKIQEVTGLGGECEEAEDDHIQADPDYDYTPAYCVKDGEKQTYDGAVDFGFFTIGQDYTYAREDLSNGKVIVTFMPTTHGGIKAGAGLEFGASEAAHGGADIEGSVEAKLGSGMTYIFDSEEEFERFEDEVNEAIAMETSRHFNPTGDSMMRFGDWLGIVDYPEIERQPDVRTTTVGIDSEINGNIGFWSGPHGSDKKEKDGESWTMNLGVEGSVSSSASRDVSTWYSNPDNIQTSETYSWSAEGTLGATAFSPHIDGTLSWNGGTRIMRNEDGSIANIRYIAGAEGKFNYGIDKTVGTRTNQGNGSFGQGQTQSVTQMVQVDFENTPEEQAAAEQLLDEYGLFPPPYMTNAMAEQLDEEDYGGEIVEEPGPDADPWDEIFYRRGTAWQYASDKEIDSGSFGASVKMGLQFGASVEWELEEGHTNHALMLDAPNDEGSRRFIDYADCLSDEYTQEEGE
ncbi:hypothetical protein [Nocardiopsis chromatogenes]|uniref:hypothetical protein n=1 Tax=Nocardiopsis chromatogenes TaxID=280239 RepID=UPI00034B830F|nr:hypothetical protein [Nocardiopsis chromatogenes]